MRENGSINLQNDKQCIVFITTGAVSIFLFRNQLAKLFCAGKCRINNFESLWIVRVLKVNCPLTIYCLY